MRCKFCGWDNPDEKDSCEKCNKPLHSIGTSSVVDFGGASSPSSHHDRPTNRQPQGAFDPKKTVREGQAPASAGQVADELCPQCGYTLQDGVCASCGYGEAASDDRIAQSAHGAAADVRKTVRPVRKGEKEHAFTLTPISEETGEAEALTYEGDATALNRDNTDPKNSTITSAEQACVSCEEGKWSIEDKSELQTTFVQARRKVELQDGDLILLGNQLYRFGCK